jgi:hypothetical protein
MIKNIEQRCELKELFNEVNRLYKKLDHPYVTKQKTNCDKCSGYTKYKKCYYIKK